MATKKPTKVELRRLLKEAEIDIVSNDKAQLFYRDGKTDEEIYLENYGDMATVTIDLLQTMKTRARDFFEKYWIVIEDVYVPNTELSITVKDVYEHLGLKKVYDDVKDLTIDGMDQLLLKTPVKKFEEKLTSMTKRKQSHIMNRSVELYNEDKFNDIHKIRILENLQDGLFEEVENAKNAEKK